MTVSNHPARHWLIIGSTAGTLAAIEAAIVGGTLVGAEAVSAAWWIRRHRDAIGAEAAASILNRLDPAGDMPDEPSFAELRAWLESIVRLHPRGTLFGLARMSGLPSSTASKVRAGRTILPDRRERLAAAVVALGRDGGRP